MDMATLKVIADSVEIVGWLCITWELVKAARIIASPDPDGINLILFALWRIQKSIDRVTSPSERVEAEIQPHEVRQKEEHEVNKPDQVLLNVGGIDNLFSRT